MKHTAKPGAQAAPAQLSDNLQQLLKNMTVEGGKLTLTEQERRKWQARIAALPPEVRSTLGVELVALSSKLVREGGPAASSLVDALCALAVEVLAASPRPKRKSSNWGAK